ncbi:DUF2493 domain-containing protein [Methylobacillus flagellatus]|uniref:DUF2493 domain-containing protein n=1 Tax=Methylobacillus flagellatus TaxID=405 RepID=UPI002853CA90|nr:DUF2493 domain-containing protein [Methylobacillus flagellatus]MDR5172979.1 DUF2493 domain-containing protein [Methylobacillus flagellatus]
MRVLVCGGREFSDREMCDRTLYQLHIETPITLLIEGGARGADSFAWSWAQSRNLQTKSFPADWNKHGKAAGPIRNQRMLDEGRPDLVLAFPGGRGTADMIRRAEAAGVKVVRVASAQEVVG